MSHILIILANRDMIDTENADGDVYKMFLGSFLEDMDNKLIQGGANTDTRSASTTPQRQSYISDYSPLSTQSPDRSPGPYGSPSTTHENTPRMIPNSTINIRGTRSSSHGFFNRSSTGECPSAVRAPSPGDLSRWETYNSRRYP